MQISNTLTKKKEEFIPLNPPNVTMYMCGPTVYDYFHIGNARSFIMADIIRAYLKYKGFKVKFVMNLTDVDDKIINKSIAENKSLEEISGFYIDAFYEDLKKLRIKPADVFPKATQHIGDMIDVINKLEKKGIAYNIDGNVYYDVSKFQNYGKLSGKNLDELESGSRVEINETKKNPLDFSLWKKAKTGEPSWDSPWGKGRPGWHIECSAMSTKELGKSIDIHAGGNDLIFPHHENEIAQSEAAFEQKFVNCWMHFGFLNIQNEKMSKSLGNFYTARDVLKRYSAEAIRLFFAQTYYGGPLNFSDELLDAAEKGAEKIRNFALRIEQEIVDNWNDKPNFDFDIQSYYNDFEKAMDDDFNSAQAIAVIFDLIRAGNKIIDGKDKNDREFFHSLKKFLQDTADDVLGIINFEMLNKSPENSIEDDLIKLLIEIRDEMKKQKNFELSDKIRNDLLNNGIILQDSKNGTAFKRK